MVEKEAVRDKEAEIGFNSYEDALKWYRERKEKAKKGVRLIKGKEKAWYVARQGVLRHYHTESDTGHALETMRLFVHEVRSHSGRHVHGTERKLPGF